MPNIDSRDFRTATGRFATGVTVITTRCGDEGDHGMTANAFMSISLDPPLIAVSIAKKAKMLARIRKAGRFAVSILSRSMERVASHFSGKPGQRLAEVFEERGGLPVIRDAVAVFTADVVNELAAGDHVIFIGHVRCLVQRPDHAPLIFSGGRFATLDVGASTHKTASN